MNKYLLPISDFDSGVWIEHTSAYNIEHAKERFMASLLDIYPIEYCETWDEFIDQLEQRSVYVGDIYDIEEF